MGEREVRLEASWRLALADQFAQPYMQELSAFLRTEQAAGKRVYPAGGLIFNALNLTPLSRVRVVILGQDPYHGEGQAHGLSFSVPPGVPPPPSLQNIFKELQRDLNLPIPDHGCLESWARQGVLLLNTALTVEAGQAGSHAKTGWHRFTDHVIAAVNEQCQHVVFMLWGAHARSKAELLDPKKHLILTSAHPSPLSAYRGFLGCGHFGRCNQFLRQMGREPIDWSLPPV